jgi:molybdenum cofactor cytidylyltransferase
MNGKTDFHLLAAIMLAAGFSRRMGPKNKLLVPLGGRPLLTYAIEKLAELGLRQVVTVAGKDAAEIGSLLPSSFTLIENSEAADGMGASIAKGAQSIDAGLRGIFIVLGDMPFIERSDYENLAAAFAPLSDDAICVPSHQGRQGHPVLFGRAHFQALSNLTGDRGARTLLTSANAEIHDVPNCSPGILIDLDDPASFAKAEYTLGFKSGARSTRSET